MVDSDHEEQSDALLEIQDAVAILVQHFEQVLGVAIAFFFEETDVLIVGNSPISIGVKGLVELLCFESFFVG